MSKSSKQDGCPQEIMSFYFEIKTKLSNGINSLLCVLEEEANQGKFTRAMTILNFLNEELNVRNLKEHVNVNFDVTEAISNVAGKKKQHKQMLKADLSDTKKVDKIAEKLNSFSRYFGWYRDDYKHYKHCLSEMIQGVVIETNEMINNLDFAGISGRFAMLERVQSKLKNILIQSLVN